MQAALHIRSNVERDEQLMLLLFSHQAMAGESRALSWCGFHTSALVTQQAVLSMRNQWF